jgi:hypothetical protein
MKRGLSALPLPHGGPARLCVFARNPLISCKRAKAPSAAESGKNSRDQTLGDI